jgi:hypothetical protein
MKRTLRVTLLTILLSLTVLTISLVGYSGYANSRATAHQMSAKIIEHTSAAIDHRINDLVFTATRQCNLSRHLLEHHLQSADDFPRLARYWYEVLDAFPNLSNIYLTLEADGTTLQLARLPDTKGITIQELRPRPSDGKMELFNYNPRDYPPRPGQRPAPVKQPDGVNLDQHTWDWYKLGRKAHEPVWTGTYIFFDENGQLTYPGVTCAAPVRRADGTLLGVIGLDLDVFALCRFLKGLTISTNGFAFVVEQRPDGTRKLIAHPDQKVLLHEVGATKGGGRRRELVDIEALRDRRVPAFMRQVPADVDPETLSGMQPVRFREDGVSYLGGYRGLDEASEPRWLSCLVIPEDDVLGQAKRNTRIVLIVGPAGRWDQRPAGPVRSDRRDAGPTR